MDIQDMILENNAMLKVLLRNQVQIIAVLDEAVAALNQNGVTEETKATREALIETRMLLVEAEVKRAKLIMMRDAAEGK